MTSILKADTIQDTDGNNIINENSNTITIGASGDTIALAGTTVTGITQGITMADQFRLSADTSVDSSGTFFTSNIERIDGTAQGKLGTGMTESSGVFTFPSTGIYYIEFILTAVRAGDSRYVESTIFASDNGGGSFDMVAQMSGHIKQADSGTTKICVVSNTLLDVTNTSNVQVKFESTSLNATTAIGSTDRNMCSFTFIRLGDT